MKISFPVLFAALATFAVACAPVSKDTVQNGNGTGIIGGTNVVEGSDLHKSIVGIYDIKRNALCTGSLIRDNVVMTAAHCIGKVATDHLIFFAADMEATFKLSETNKEAFLKIVRRGAKTVQNAEWGKKHTGKQAWGDIALIQFGGKAPEGFKPATMLANSSALVAGASVVLAGYGVDNDVLTDVKPSNDPEFKKGMDSGKIFCDDTDMSKAKCYAEDVKGEGTLRTTDVVIEDNFNATEIALNQKNGKAACEGDSGGPAYIKVGNEYQLWGVTSRGTRGCNGYVLYTNAVALNQWVTDEVANFAK
ncbi:MAG: trypsin-like serine protease [Bdellovibrionaceae bacterium]|nr:trypsin-like serine protease [Pseudobdellovibrionaceae bacterium]